MQASLIVALLLACTTQDRPRPTDLGGVALHVTQEPLVQIGAADGPEAEQFYRIRNVLRMRDGRIVVADGGSQQLRFFDPRGVHIRSIGGQGGGPGEFENLRWAKRTAADSLIAWDGNLLRATVFDPQGLPVRVFAIPADPEFPLTVPDQIFWNGAILSLAGPPIEEPDSAGRGYWGMVALTRTAPDGLEMARVSQVKWRRCPDPGCTRRVTSFQALWAAANDEVFYYRPDQPLVQILGTDGQRRTNIPLRNLPVRPDTMPAVTALFPDRHGLIWLEMPDNQWRAFSSDGELQAELRVPSGLVVHDITMEYVLGVAVDDLGVERVVLFGTERD